MLYYITIRAPCSVARHTVDGVFKIARRANPAGFPTAARVAMARLI